MTIALNVHYHLFNGGCTIYKGAVFTSPNGEFNAHGEYTMCDDKPAEMKILLNDVDEENPRIIFESIYTTSERMDLRWESDNKLTVLYPKSVTPKTKLQASNGIQLFYKTL